MAEQDLSTEALRTLLKDFIAERGQVIDAQYGLKVGPGTFEGISEATDNGLLRLGQWLVEIEQGLLTASYSIELAPGQDLTLLVHVERHPEGLTISEWYVEESF